MVKSDVTIDIYTYIYLSIYLSIYLFGIILKWITVHYNQDNKKSYSYVENGESIRQAPEKAWLPKTILV